MKKKIGSGKIAFPRLENVIIRERLFSLLEASQAKLITWVSGPPGAGKTTLVSSYITQHKKPYLWVRCDKTDNDIGSFISYLSFAAEQAQSGLGKSLPTFTPDYAGDAEPFIRNYLRKLLETLKQETIIVLDDFHEVQHEGILAQCLSAMADEFNGAHAFIIISRKPVLEILARIQFNQQLMQIGWEQLQLTEEETKDFIELQGGAHDQTRIKQLHKLCKGWIAALKMIVLSTHSVALEEPPTEDNLDQTIFFNYLAQETFNHLAHGQKQALMLLALSPSITTKHLALAANADCNVMQIEQLLNQQLVQKYVKPIIHYKFHPLYKEFLQQQAQLMISEANRNQITLTSANILFQQGLTFEAAELYMQLNYYEKLAEIVLVYGEAMCKQGRYAELEAWLNHLPEHNFEQEPWLLYWHAASLLTTQQKKSKQKFQKAHELFLLNNDVIGIYLSWCSALEASVYTFSEFLFLKNWLKQLDFIRDKYPKYPSLEIRMRVLGARFFTYFLGYPQSSDINEMLDSCYRMVRFVPVPALRVMVGTGLAWATCIKGDGAKFTKVVDILRRYINEPSIAPFHRIAASIPIAYHDWSTSSKFNNEFAQQGLALAEKTGIHHLDGVLIDHIAMSFLVKGELVKAKDKLDKLTEENYQSHGVSYSAILMTTSMFELERGELIQACETTEVLLEVTLENGLQMPYAASLNLHAEILSALGKYEQALTSIDKAHVIANDIESNMLKFQGMISRAVVACHMKDLDGMVSYISSAFVLGKENKIYAYKGVVRSSILKLCIVAYEHNIETDYAAKLVELYQLSYPVDQAIIEYWPWRIKLRVFKEFGVSIRGDNLSVKNKSQRKAIELLQVLTAMGGKSVESWQIAEILWPDSDGDAMQQALDTTIHRLRKIISKEAIVVQNNKLSLASEHCWTDIWQFEAIVMQLDKSITEKLSANEIYYQAKQLLNIYTGVLLQDVDASWLISKREKYTSEFLRSIDQAVDYLQTHSSFEQVIELAQMAILRAPDQENFYLHAMQSYRAIGHNSKALDVFRRCEQNFRQSQGSSLSSQIIELADSLK